MSKALKWVGGIILALALLIMAIGWIASKALPTGKTGPEADALAREMMEAVDKAAWDSTRWVSWTFMDMHHFTWDKDRHLVEVKWKDYRVLLDPNTISGKAWSGGTLLEGEAAKKKVLKAWDYFCNDSFWLNAVVKAFDPGTERRLVELEDGTQAVMVSYSMGGVTPGDSYLWILDEDGKPKAWQMWVKVIPIGGIETSWSEWKTLPTGAKIATWHGGSLGKGVGVRITNLQGGMELADVGLEADPFEEM